MSNFLTAIPRAVTVDRTGLLGSFAGVVAGLPPGTVAAYLAARLLLPVVLIGFASRGATPAQRIALVRDHLALGSR
jgi:hypothetical protein